MCYINVIFNVCVWALVYDSNLLMKDRDSLRCRSVRRIFIHVFDMTLIYKKMGSVLFLFKKNIF